MRLQHSAERLWRVVTTFSNLDRATASSARHRYNSDLWASVPRKCKKTGKFLTLYQQLLVAKDAPLKQSPKHPYVESTVSPRPRRNSRRACLPATGVLHSNWPSKQLILFPFGLLLRDNSLVGPFFVLAFLIQCPEVEFWLKVKQKKLPKEKITKRRTPRRLNCSSKTKCLRSVIKKILMWQHIKPNCRGRQFLQSYCWVSTVRFL